MIDIECFYFFQISANVCVDPDKVVKNQLEKLAGAFNFHASVLHNSEVKKCLFPHNMACS